MSPKKLANLEAECSFNHVVGVSVIKFSVDFSRTGFKFCHIFSELGFEYIED
jgi:hypothetical protein